MIAPAAAELEVTWRVPFTMKAEALNEGNRRRVLRLDVCLQSVKPELSEGVMENEPEGLGHVALPGERRADLVAEVGALEAAADNLAQLDSTNEGGVVGAADEETDEIGSLAAREVTGELRGGSRRHDPWRMECAAPPVQGEDVPLIASLRKREVDCGSPARGDWHPRSRHLNSL